MAYRPEASLQGQASLTPTDPQVEVLAEKVRQACRAGAKPMPPSRTRSAARPTLAVDTERMTMEEAREAGSVRVGHQMWQQLGLNEILRAAGLSNRPCQLSEVMTVNRLLFPLCEHAMPGWIERGALDEILGTDFSALSDEALYRAIGRLKERYPRVARYYRIDYEAELNTLRWEKDCEKKAVAEKLDVGYVLKTDGRT